MKIQDIPFNPRHTEAEMQKGLDWLKKEKISFRGNGNFCIVGTDDEKNVVASYYTNMSCHKMITDTHLSSRSVVATEIGWSRRLSYLGAGQEGSKEVFEPFFNWFFKESVYSRFVLYADIDVGFIVSADIAAPIMQNILIVTRHFHEVALEAFQMFNKLLDKGFDPNICYPCCFNSAFSTKYTKLNQAVRSYVGHRAHPLWNLEAFNNFLSGEMGDAELNSRWTSSDYQYRYDKHYKGGWQLFTRKGFVPSYGVGGSWKGFFTYELMEKEDFKELVREYRKEKNGGVYKPPNPFDTSNRVSDAPKADELTYEEFFDIAVPYLHKEGVLNRGQ